MSQQVEEYRLKIKELEARLAESEQLIEAIKAGEVDAFAVNDGNQPEVYTLQSGDYTYRMLIEKFSEGAVNLTEDKLIVYTNTYFVQLMNLPYERVIGSSFTDFIDPGSRENFNALFTTALRDVASKGEINLRISDNIIPVYVSLTSLQPKLATVGMIITDLTEKKKNEEVILQYQRVLEKKNNELSRTNAELVSFSYIASHDLQEPLRKIQTFIGRILEDENKEPSATITDYFQRIVAATTRMQNLINALLEYSRTNNPNLAYELTDLNKIVEEAGGNLREIIEDKKVIIKNSGLPALMVVPLQFSQVFVNIIGNAIKYRHADRQPVINIGARLVNKNEVPDGEGLPGNKYWKIDIQDNGIGFEQKYEPKIYQLFQRLHGRSEYEGTGIGLAICKKIVENHAGVLRATSEPGVGSIFSIYLPVREGYSTVGK